MADAVIKVTQLSKSYRIRHNAGEPGAYGYVALRDVLSEAMRAPLRWLSKRRGAPERRRRKRCDLVREDFWALKDVGFEVKRGECVGIIGRNGAGKSTLLKVLSRIIEPTTGRVMIDGRVASLLEVGTGFHPELTGRENIFLNGAILGMSRAEIQRKFDEIVAFADIERFLDTPVKRYSSGMYVRLAFAVAAHVEPEILIVDEVLAVGDAEFQKKCLGKMQEVTKGGRTVLFVSHDMNAISTLTTAGILLDEGTIAFSGSSVEAITRYLNTRTHQLSGYAARANPLKPKITRVEVRTSKPNHVQVCGEPLEVRFEISTPSAIRGACLSLHILDHRLRRVVHVWTFDADLPMCRTSGRHVITCKIPKLRLYMGQYTLQIYLSEPPGGDVLESLEGICPFEVVMHGHSRQFPWRSDACTYLEEAFWEAKLNPGNMGVLQ